MRVLFATLFALLVAGILRFMAINAGTTMPLTVWATRYEDVHVGYVVIVSIVVGVVFASIFAIAEGAKIRLENRRLRKEIHQLSTEIGFLRTQPAPERAIEPDAPLAPTPDTEKPVGPDPSIPTAPVYDSDDDWPPDPDDDAYSGGRAV